MLRTVLPKTARPSRKQLHLGTGLHHLREIRRNCVGIQLIPAVIRERVFRSGRVSKPEKDLLMNVQSHLEKHKLWNRESDPIADVSIDLPELLGDNLEQHFREIGKKYTEPYLKAVRAFVDATAPPIPKQFVFREGWVRYDADEKQVPVEAPQGKAIVFDVETILTEGGLPAIATALSDTHWYSWCSSALVRAKDHHVESVTPDMLVPLGSGNCEQVVIGHHVGFDRSFVKEEYNNSCPKRRFLDTLSMHVCVSGQTSDQRIQYLKMRKNEMNNIEIKNNSEKQNTKLNRKEETVENKRWYDVSAPNSLAEVYRFYCKDELSKSERKIFEEGSSDDVRANFQDLMKYCATDVKATRDVFVKLFFLFRDRLSHDITLFGMMEMLTAYLPVNQNWIRYMNQAEAVYQDVNAEIRLILNMIANRVCRMNQGEAWRKDPWLWDLDWGTQKMKPKSISTLRSKKLGAVEQTLARRPFMPGYPKWYRDLCISKPTDLAGGPELDFGAWNISTQMRCVPKLMKLMWNGYPLHHHDEHGWGYLLPAESEDQHVTGVMSVGNRSETQSHNDNDASDYKPRFPYDEYRKIIEESQRKRTSLSTDTRTPDPISDNIDCHLDATGTMKTDFGKSRNADKYNVYKRSPNNKPNNKTKSFNVEESESTFSKVNANSDLYDIGIHGVRFRKLPHKHGPKYNVGNPLSKDFISQFEGNVLTSWEDDNANTLLRLGKQATYWKNARDRLKEQLVVWVGQKEGVILPRLMPAGTISRRAVEKTWLTASNARKDRIGSELKAMIQAPDGMHFVGADVDSQELWIASLLGDAAFAKLPGCTAFGWMTLQGNKADGTDMHSRTAASAGCSRDHAKVLNYARIYGAGQKFSATLLKQFNPSLTEEEAAACSSKMFKSTKGTRSSTNTDDFVWCGGSESHMFNELEKIAKSEKTSTPVLGAQISQALQSKYVSNKYMTSRINWVVQSSAVDYLHLMLASMKYLSEKFEIDQRLVVSIHDEVRFMVRSEDRYRASLALHITNLLVRALFAEKVGMDDLPFSVAFFSAVDIDRVIRKNVADDSVTPSNPHGLYKNYGIPYGEEVDIYKSVELTNGGKLHKDKFAFRECNKRTNIV